MGKYVIKITILKFNWRKNDIYGLCIKGIFGIKVTQVLKCYQVKEKILNVTFFEDK